MADSWETLKSECAGCTRCPLGDTRRHLVFGTGNEHARIMLIGEGPGEQEDLQGVPFVGPAGKLLDDMLEMIDLDRTKVYIANIVKCRPPRNRDPQPDEKENCIPWLRRQIVLVDPEIIVCLGRIAAMELIRDNFRITREHGLWFAVDGRSMTAIYHPSALLRDVSKRPETFADLRAIRQQIRAICPEVYEHA
jgi:DNA polymerase